MLPKKVRAELDATGLPWDIQAGKKHLHIRVDGRLVAIWPRRPNCRSKGEQNVIAQIRRAPRNPGAHYG